MGDKDLGTIFKWLYYGFFILLSVYSLLEFLLSFDVIVIYFWSYFTLLPIYLFFSFKYLTGYIERDTGNWVNAIHERIQRKEGKLLNYFKAYVGEAVRDSYVTTLFVGLLIPPMLLFGVLVSM